MDRLIASPSMPPSIIFAVVYNGQKVDRENRVESRVGDIERGE